MSLFGLQPGKLHLGNIISLLEWKNNATANNYKKVLLIADLHRLTKKISYNDNDNINQNCIDHLLKLDLINNDDIVIIQSKYQYFLLDMMWKIASILNINYLNKIFNIRCLEQKNFKNVALFLYPLLMVCDLILFGEYNLTVGFDQKMHIEFFNKLNIIKNINRIKNFYYTEKILMLNSEEKMSKSLEKSNPNGIIFLNEDVISIRKKILKARTFTSSYQNIEELNKNEFIHVKNIIKCISTITNNSFEETVKKYLNTNFITLKNDFLYHYLELQKKFCENKITKDLNINNLSNNIIEERMNDFLKAFNKTN